MLENLTVNNIALIESLTIEFEDGFNVLSGETGAGKSIIIGALGLLLGGKSSADIIRANCDEASVSGSFYVAPNNKSALNWLKEHSIEPDNNRILIRRSVRTTGRSTAWIENTQVSRPELQEFTSFLVDIHGQHDHQSLFKLSEHRKFLDSFAGIEDEVEQYSGFYNMLKEEREKLNNLNTSEKERLERIDYLTYATEEIEKAKLRDGEDEELESEAKKLDEYEDLFANVQKVDNCLTGENAVVPLLKKTLSSLKSAASVDSTLEPLCKRIEEAYYELDDVSSEVGSYFSNLSFDPARVDEIQERLTFIYKLKKKYGATIPQIKEYYKKAVTELETLTQSSENKDSLEKKIAELQAEIFKRGTQISKKRSAAAEILEKKVEDILKHLGMAKTHFSVQVHGKQVEGNKQTAGLYGFDDIEFLISANLGEPLKPLAKIASGGELSRVMLALKTVLASNDYVDTLIFDEIDTGIGGEVAINVASHMKSLSKQKQILCVTHLAVIASNANNQIKIKKSFDDNKTKTYAHQIVGNERVEEIARMLSGDEDSSASMAHAEELLRKFSS